MIPDFDLSKSRNQSVYATCVALFFISFEVDADSQVIGFSVANVNDQRLEFFAFVGASLLFLNLCMRIFEKYRNVGLKSLDDDFSATKALMEAHVTRIKGQCAEISASENELKELRSAISGIRDASFLNQLERQLETARIEFGRLFQRFRGKLASQLDGSDNLELADSTQSAADQVRRAVGDVEKKIEDVEKRSQSLSEKISSINKAALSEEKYYHDSYQASLEKIENAVSVMANPSENKWHTINQNLRILLFDAIIPILIYILLSLVYFSDWARAVFLCMPSLPCMMQTV